MVVLAEGGEDIRMVVLAGGEDIRMVVFAGGVRIFRDVRIFRW